LKQTINLEQERVSVDILESAICHT